ncbi:hypothetical protein C1645_882288 [Glomus cerebriforme]|uniref:F-box domain-containing protein n=1 Tax=Glomus cerebriforme TaxID=658196 RepID=A0A397SBV4_9GLOM|nr:hypothetical protein C1645_882288 [Glomus cerebriforme]
MKLNTDIIRNIILFINDDKTSLFSCLLINKAWCSQTIDILWSKPFRLIYSCASQFDDQSVCRCSFMTKRRQAATLIKTYFSFLILEYEQELIDNCHIKKEQILIPKFDYINYLRYIDIHEMDLSIIDFYIFNEISFNENLQDSNNNNNNNNNNEDEERIIPENFFNFFQEIIDDTTNDSQSTLSIIKIIKYLASRTLMVDLRNTFSEYQIISEILLKFIIGKCKNLKRLSLDINHIYQKSLYNPCKDFQRYPTALSFYKRSIMNNPEYKAIDIYLSIPKYVNARNCLSNIKELICTTRRNISDFLFALSKYVRNLDKLEINIDFPMETNYSNFYLSREHNLLKFEVTNLIKLIRNQKRLSHLILYNCPVDFFLIMKELKESQAENLKILSLIGIKFDNNNNILYYLKFLTSLQKFQLVNCTIIQNNYFEYLTEKLFLPNLIMIDLNNSFISYQFLQCLLQICSSDLEYLDIGKKFSSSLIEFNFNPIQFISTNFSNIKFLRCGLISFENNDLITLLSSSCNIIESIILDNNYDNDENNFAKCLSRLSEINFINLNYFGIRGNFKFSEFTLSHFLINNIRNNRALKLFTLEFTNNIWFNDDYLKEILKCLDDGFVCYKLIICAYNKINPDLLIKARKKIKIVQYVDRSRS